MPTSLPAHHPGGRHRVRVVRVRVVRLDGVETCHESSAGRFVFATRASSVDASFARFGGEGEPGAPNRNPSSITPKSMATRGWRASAPPCLLACASDVSMCGCVRERNGSAERVSTPSRFQGGFQIRAGDVNADPGAPIELVDRKEKVVFLSARRGSGFRRLIEASIVASPRARPGRPLRPRRARWRWPPPRARSSRRAPTPSRAPPAAAPVAWSRVARSPSPRPKAR